jgi:hypothetical protein
MSTENTKIAVEQQHKFQLYLVALVFTVLGLSIQTAPGSFTTLTRCAELIGWLLELVSGLAGLWYLEWSPNIRMQMTGMQKVKDELKLMRSSTQTHFTNSETGEVGLVADRIRLLEQSETEKLKSLKRTERNHLFAYRLLKYSFVLGLISLGIARGYPIAAGIDTQVESSASEIFVIKASEIKY